jgi:hypothetical protein
MSTASKSDRQSKEWTMPSNGLCGIGDEFAGRSWIEILLGTNIEDDCDLFFEDDEFGYGIEAGERFLSRLYGMCIQMNPQPGSDEYDFVRAYDFREDCPEGYLKPA